MNWKVYAFPLFSNNLNKKPIKFYILWLRHVSTGKYKKIVRRLSLLRTCITFQDYCQTENVSNKTTKYPTESKFNTPTCGLGTAKLHFMTIYGIRCSISRECLYVYLNLNLYELKRNKVRKFKKQKHKRSQINDKNSNCVRGPSQVLFIHVYV